MSPEGAPHDDDDDELAARYAVGLGAALVRGLRPDLAPAQASDADVFRAGLAAGVRLHKFKRNAALPRVARVLSMLAGLAPSELLDVGSGRGTFLWPLLEAFPSLSVTAVDRDARRARDLEAVARGGHGLSLAASRADAEQLPFAPGAFDGATALEVLEHVRDPLPVARELFRVARRFVVVSVPSTPDDNPEHVRLFDQPSLVALLSQAGARRVTVTQVPNHFLALGLS